MNNAATVVSKDSTEVTAEDMANTLGTNVEASYHLCQLAHPLLKASGNGSIVFISSVAAVVALPTLTFYGASKGEDEDLYVSAAVLMSKFYYFFSEGCSLIPGALNQLTRSLACEWGSDKIRVNAVAPWIIKTPLLDASLARTGSEQVIRFCSE